MSSFIDGTAIGAMLFSLIKDEQHADIPVYKQHELVEKQEKWPCSPARLSTCGGVKRIAYSTVGTIETAEFTCC